MEAEVKPLSTVDQVLVKLLQAYPSLRQTRLDALHDVLTYSGNTWDVNGNVVISPECFEWADIDGRRKDRERPDEILFARSEALKEHFVRDNAELIIRAGNSYRAPFPSEYCSGFGFASTMPRAEALYLFRDIHTGESKIPDNANPEWIAAFIELFEEILHFRYSDAYVNSGRANIPDTLKNLEKAKEQAREWLIRLKATDTEKMDLERSRFEAELDKLKKMAARRGVKIEGTVA